MRIRRKKEHQTDEARRFINWTDFVKDRVFVGPRLALKISAADARGEKLHLETPNGTVLVEQGDWVCKRDDGTYYAMKDSSFQSLYEVFSLDKQHEDEADKRRQVGRILMSIIQTKGISTYNQLLGLIEKFADCGGEKENNSVAKSKEPSV